MHPHNDQCLKNPAHLLTDILQTSSLGYSSLHCAVDMALLCCRCCLA